MLCISVAAAVLSSSPMSMGMARSGGGGLTGAGLAIALPTGLLPAGVGPKASAEGTSGGGLTGTGLTAGGLTKPTGSGADRHSCLSLDFGGCWGFGTTGAEVDEVEAAGSGGGTGTALGPPAHGQDRTHRRRENR
jgi:hypothetical protein